MKIPRKQFDASIPSTAMGDIAFLLLIFFVILARAVDDSHLQWEPASADEVEQTGAARASVVIDADSKLYLNGKETPGDQLGGALESLLGSTPPGKRVVFLKVDKEVTAKFFEPAIESISQAGGDLVHVLEYDGSAADETPN